MDFLRLFVYLDHCNQSSKIEISSDDRVLVHSSCWERFRCHFLNKQKANQVTLAKITGLVQDWSEFKKLTDADRDEILQQLTPLTHASSKSLQLEARHIRKIYRSVIAKQLDGFAQFACTHHRYERIQASSLKHIQVQQFAYSHLSNPPLDPNKLTHQLFLTSLYAQYGRQRIDRILKAFEIDLEQLYPGTKPLYVGDIINVYAGLIDVHADDVQDTYGTIRQAIRENDSRLLNNLPEKIQEAIARERSKELSLLDILKQQFGETHPLPEKYTDLSKDQMKFLIELIAIPQKDVEKLLLGRRLEGVTEGQRRIESADNYFFNRLLEDRIKIQGFQEVYQNTADNETEQDRFYLEMWTKLFIKNEGSLVHDMYTDMLIPAPSGEWYKIEKKENKLGKFLLCMKPVTNPERPSLMIHRSTASSPYSSNSSLSVIQDANPYAPPGYYGEKVNLESEFQFFKDGTNPLTITGHSLGGSFTQLNMINFLERLQLDNTPFPNRQIKLVIFDSPAIKKADTEYFARWAKKNPEDAKKITIEYYFSKPDLIPGAGESHLGAGCEDTEVTVNFHLVDTKEGADVPELQLHPHGRFFFRSRETLSNIKLESTDATGLAEFDAQPWRWRMELFRLIVGPLLFFPLKLWLWLKELVVKREDTLSNTEQKTTRVFNSI